VICVVFLTNVHELMIKMKVQSHVWGYVPLAASRPPQCLYIPFSNLCIMIHLLRCTPTNAHNSLHILWMF